MQMEQLTEQLESARAAECTKCADLIHEKQTVKLKYEASLAQTQADVQVCK